MQRHVQHRSRHTALITLLIAAAVAEGLALVGVVPLARAVATGSRTATGVGPLDVFPTSTTGLALLTGGLLVAALAVRLVASRVQAGRVVAEERVHRGELYDAYLAASPASRAAESTGRLQWLSTLSAGYAELLNARIGMLRFGINVAIMMILAVAVSVVGALVIACVGGILYLAFRPLLGAARRATERSVDARQRVDLLAAEFSALATPIFAFGVEPEARRRLHQATGEMLRYKRRTILLTTISSPLYTTAGMLIVVAVLGISGARSTNIAPVGAVALLLLRSLAYTQNIQTSLHKLAEMRPIVNACEEAIAFYRAHRFESGTDQLGPVRQLDLVDVTFSYADTDHPALQGVSLRISAGEHVGIVGPSGAGKSTLAQLLIGVLEPSSGDLLLNGISVTSLSRSDRARQVAYVPQQVQLLAGSLADNVRFMRPIDIADVEQAVAEAGLATVSTALPDGLDTAIGATAHGLSGGQVQRIGIARALAGRPSLVVLDEPTSALDADAEALITDTVRNLADDVIVVMIAHRASTLKHCTRVVVVEHGRVVADGPPDQLSVANPFFARAMAGLVDGGPDQSGRSAGQ